MALFKIFKGLKANLPKTYNDGYCYVTTDDGKMYIDTTNDSSGRICLNAGHADTAQNANYATESNHAQSADSATKLATARTISLTGDVTGSGSFDGSGNLSITTAVADNSHNHTNYLPLTGGTVTGSLMVDNGNSSGLVELLEDAEGGTIILRSKNGTYQYHIDAYNDETIRIHTADLNPNGDYKQASWNGKTGELVATSFTGPLNGNAATATNVAWSGVTGKPSTYPPESHTHSYLPLSGGTLSGPIYIHNSNMTISAGKIEQYGGAPYGGLFSNGVAFTNPTTQNDAAWLRVTGTSENDTVFEIAVGDDGNAGIGAATVEEIVVRQYGTDNAVNRQITLLDKSGNSHFRAAYGAVWNDYAEFRSQDEHIEPGYCVTSSRSGKVSKTVERLQYCEGIVSDTFGFAIGETNECKTPLAVSGRVLAYYDGNIEDYDIGDVVCAGPEGKVCKMSREEIKKYPDRIVGTISEFPSYEFWGDGKAPTKERIWIKVK